jgi:hypothetical protein
MILLPRKYNHTIESYGLIWCIQRAAVIPLHCHLVNKAAVLVCYSLEAVFPGDATRKHQLIPVSQECLSCLPPGAYRMHFDEKDTLQV